MVNTFENIGSNQIKKNRIRLTTILDKDLKAIVTKLNQIFWMHNKIQYAYFYLENLSLK
jgi:hypothetical protein